MIYTERSNVFTCVKICTLLNSLFVFDYSVRWKLLLGFSCRNRLLLSGTPIQNSMAELWALLHFIMPTMFDSHDEFNEWFSKDIESHAENKTSIDESKYVLLLILGASICNSFCDKCKFLHIRACLDARVVLSMSAGILKYQ